MKKVLLFLTMVFLVCAASAQTKFSIPVPTLEQKYNLAKVFMYNNVLAAINVAKSAGMTVEEFAKKEAELYKWNEDMGYEQFVNTVLYQYSCLSDSIKIVDQSVEKVVFAVRNIYPQLQNQGVFLGVTFDEFVQWTDAMYSVIANNIKLKPTCNAKKIQGGMEISISR